MWSYTDVYCSLVDYVSPNLKDGTFKLKWGIVAIAELMPRVIIHFTLRNVHTNLVNLASIESSEKAQATTKVTTYCGPVTTRPEVIDSQAKEEVELREKCFFC